MTPDKIDIVTQATRHARHAQQPEVGPSITRQEQHDAAQQRSERMHAHGLDKSNVRVHETEPAQLLGKDQGKLKKVACGKRLFRLESTEDNLV